MNNIEEKLWDYIDGNCTADEQKAISAIIAADEAVRLQYQELLKVNSEFAAMELDEPPMAFTFNVMEGIRAEHAQVPLKAAINKKMILGIAIFFTFTILAMLVFAFLNMNWPTLAASNSPAITVKLPHLSNYFTKPVAEGFIFFDVILAMFLVDSFLRKNISKQIE